MWEKTQENPLTRNAIINILRVFEKSLPMCVDNSALRSRGILNDNLSAEHTNYWSGKPSKHPKQHRLVSSLLSAQQPNWLDIITKDTMHFITGHRKVSLKLYKKLPLCQIALVVLEDKIQAAEGEKISVTSSSARNN